MPQGGVRGQNLGHLRFFIFYFLACFQGSKPVFMLFSDTDDDCTVLSILSGLKTRSLGLNTLGTT